MGRLQVEGRNTSYEVEIKVIKHGDKTPVMEETVCSYSEKTVAVLLYHELDARDLLSHRLQILYCTNTYKF